MSNTIKCVFRHNSILCGGRLFKIIPNKDYIHAHFTACLLHKEWLRIDTPKRKVIPYG